MRPCSRVLIALAAFAATVSCHATAHGGLVIVDFGTSSSTSATCWHCNHPLSCLYVYVVILVRTLADVGT